jgi:hypothetical protein
VLNVLITMQDPETKKLKTFSFDQDAAGAIEFLQGIPRARNADAHAAEMLEQNAERFRQLDIFQETVKRNFK